MSRLLDAAAVRLLAGGTAVLGSGGGGDSEIGLLAALQAVEEYGPAELCDLGELPGDGLVMPCGMIGAPTVHIEKYVNGGEGARLRTRLEELRERPVVALMCAEVGGSNGLLPVAWAARMGLPLLDADGMGRAFPRIPQLSMELAGISPCPSVLTDERGHEIVFHGLSGDWLERLVRAAVVEMGGAGSGTEYSLTVAEARSATVVGFLGRAMAIGRAVAGADGNPVEALVEHLGAFRLLKGKIADVERQTAGGFATGSVLLHGLEGDAGRELRIAFQNENLAAFLDGEVRALVPDIISIVDSETADVVVTERLRYGQRVTALSFPCDPIWRSPAGLALAGPGAFGHDLDYVPVEELNSAGC